MSMNTTCHRCQRRFASYNVFAVATVKLLALIFLVYSDEMPKRYIVSAVSTTRSVCTNTE